MPPTKVVPNNEVQHLNAPPESGEAPNTKKIQPAAPSNDDQME